MFYLVELFKILKQNKILGSLFFIGIFGVMSISHFEKDIKQQLSISDKVEDFPYFNALLRTDINIEGVKRRMVQLPGVQSVELGAKKSLNKEISRLKGMFGNDVVESLSSIKYKKLRVELEKGVKVKSLTLIKEYLARLVGKKSITFGHVKRPNNVKLKKQDPLFKVLNWADTYALILFIGLWFISTILLTQSFMKQAYIIQKFQRKTNVGHKLLAISLALSLGASLVINFAVKMELNSLSIICMFSILVLAHLSYFSLDKLKKSGHAF